MKVLLTHTSTTGSCSKRESKDLKRKYGEKIEITKSNWGAGTYRSGEYDGEKVNHRYDRLDLHPKIIEVNSLEDLLKLKEDVGSNLIITGGGMGMSPISTLIKYSGIKEEQLDDVASIAFEIEVYNDYRE